MIDDIHPYSTTKYGRRILLPERRIAELEHIQLGVEDTKPKQLGAEAGNQTYSMESSPFRSHQDDLGLSCGRFRAFRKQTNVRERPGVLDKLSRCCWRGLFKTSRCGDNLPMR